MTSRALVPYRKATIDISRLAVYRKLNEHAIKERKALDKLQDQCNTILDRYENSFPDLTQILDSLTLELRMIVRGTPVTEPLDPVQIRNMRDEMGNEQQYQALSLLLKKAYKKVAQLAHPDKGGSKEVFHEVEEAYRDRDLPRLNAIYIQLSAGRDIYWQQSDEGLYHASNEYQRSSVMRQQIVASRGYQVVRQHSTGNFNHASFLMESILHERIQELRNELNHIRQNHEQSTIEGERTVDQIFQSQS
jgi:hypothetical protein